jgi:hypothetical protein
VIQASDQIVIDRPVEEVFAFVADRSNLPRWSSVIKESRRTSASSSEVGTTYRMVGSLMGRRVEGTYTRTGYDPDHMLGGRAAMGNMSFDEEYRFAPVGTGTRMSMTTSITPAGMFRLLQPLMRVGIIRNPH